MSWKKRYIFYCSFDLIQHSSSTFSTHPFHLQKQDNFSRELGSKKGRKGQSKSKRTIWYTSRLAGATVGRLRSCGVFWETRRSAIGQADTVCWSYCGVWQFRLLLLRIPRRIWDSTWQCKIGILTKEWNWKCCCGLWLQWLQVEACVEEVLALLVDLRTQIVCYELYMEVLLLARGCYLFGLSYFVSDLAKSLIITNGSFHMLIAPGFWGWWSFLYSIIKLDRSEPIACSKAMGVQRFLDRAMKCQHEDRGQARKPVATREEWVNHYHIWGWEVLAKLVPGSLVKFMSSQS